MKTMEELLDENIEEWVPVEGDKIIGVFVEKREKIGKFNNTMYVLDIGGGHLVGVWGSAVISDKLQDAAAGDKVGIKYIGEAQGQHGKYKNYKVVVEPAAREKQETLG